MTYSSKTLSTANPNPEIVDIDDYIYMDNFLIQIDNEDGSVWLRDPKGYALFKVTRTLEYLGKSGTLPKDSILIFRGLNIVVMPTTSYATVVCLWDCSEFRIIVSVDTSTYGIDEIVIGKDYNTKTIVKECANMGILPYKFVKLSGEI